MPFVTFGLMVSGALASCALGEFDDAATRLRKAGDVNARQVSQAAAWQIGCLVAHHQKDLVEAEKLALQSLEAGVDRGHRREIIIGFQLLAMMAAAHGSWAETARLAGVAATTGDQWTLSRRTEPYSRLFDEAVAVARAALGDAAYEASFAEGRALSLDAAVEFVTGRVASVGVLRSGGRHSRRPNARWPTSCGSASRTPRSVGSC